MYKYKRIKKYNKDQHIIVMEDYLGRPIEKGFEIVHHIDNNPRNNVIDNLELCTRSTHAKWHAKQAVSAANVPVGRGL